ncbi:MAG: Mut7-C RNAse domain-containing protein [Nitrospiraceae bacterium]|nr:Mut7-C RNAse domain-containing protein [Nitrospiraceae bacterium]
MRFIADAMLGRLARWLRLLGYDTAFERGIDDNELLRKAKKEERTILTRDTRLVERKAARGQSFLIGPDDPFEQLKQVMAHFSLERGGKNVQGRCTLCNGPVMGIEDKERVRERVPEYVFLSRNAFYECLNCGHVYWEGTHHERFAKLLDDIIKKGR